jgi:hypothetical protein
VLHRIPRPFPLPPPSTHGVKCQLRVSRFIPINANHSSALITGHHPPPRHLYKGRAPPFSTAPLPALLLFSLCPSAECTERLLHHFFITIARPPHCLPIFDKRPIEFPVQPSFRCAIADEPPWPGAAARLSSSAPPPRPCSWSAVDQRRPLSMDGGPRPPYLPLKKKFHAGKSPPILQLAPRPSVKSSRSPQKF